MRSRARTPPSRPSALAATGTATQRTPRPRRRTTPGNAPNSRASESPVIRSARPCTRSVGAQRYDSRGVRRYHVTTCGCQMNAHDSERIKRMLEELALGEARAQAEADVIVFNTCTVREKPDQRFAAHLAQARALKAGDPEKVIAVGGCYAEAQRERLFELYPYVDVAFGPGSIPHLGEWIGAGGFGVQRG